MTEDIEGEGGFNSEAEWGRERGTSRHCFTCHQNITVRLAKSDRHAIPPAAESLLFATAAATMGRWVMQL